MENEEKKSAKKSASNIDDLSVITGICKPITPSI